MFDTITLNLIGMQIAMPAILLYAIIGVVALLYLIAFFTIIAMSVKLGRLKKTNKKLEELVNINAMMLEEMKKRPNRPQMPPRPPMPPHGHRW